MAVPKPSQQQDWPQNPAMSGTFEGNRSRGRWMQFSLRTLLTLMLVVAAFLAGRMPVQRELERLRAIEKDAIKQREMELKARREAEKALMQAKRALSSPEAGLHSSHEELAESIRDSISGQDSTGKIGSLGLSVGVSHIRHEGPRLRTSSHGQSAEPTRGSPQSTLVAPKWKWCCTNAASAAQMGTTTLSVSAPSPLGAFAQQMRQVQSVFFTGAKWRRYATLVRTVGTHSLRRIDTAVCTRSGGSVSC